ncbi:MAG: IclR family transcriptional regulator [Burkholderiaceae bacterium]
MHALSPCPDDPARFAMSSLNRILAVLDLLTATRPEVSAEQIAEALAISLPTSYRYVRELVGAGLLRRASEGRYALGARIIELDYQMRTTDPLARAAQAEMSMLVPRIGYPATLVSLLGERMITLHLEQGSEPLDISYGRGRPMPVLRGTPGLTLLAHLPRARQRALFETETAESATREAHWEALRTRLKAIRRAGFGISEGELDAHNAGVAVPVADADGRTVASLCAVLPRARLELVNTDRLVQRLQESAREIAARLAGSSGDLTLPPPALPRAG